mgnify:CR=1 FL=1
MNRLHSLLFALVGTALLVGIAAAISYGNAAAVWLCSIGSVAFIGYGFALKAKLRRKRQETPTE